MCMYIYYLSYIVYWLPIYYLLIALDAHMFSHNGNWPWPRAEDPKAAGPGPENPGSLVYLVLSSCADLMVTRTMSAHNLFVRWS